LSAGLENLQVGKIFFDGDKVADSKSSVAPAIRGAGLMFQDYMLFPHLSVLENVQFGLNRLPASQQIREAKLALEQVGMAQFGNKFPHMLSGGEQQRVALARAIVPKPKVLLLDEPFSGLDLSLRRTLRADTLRLLQDLGTTTLMVTHDPEEALLMGDRIAIMKAGEILQEGTGADLYSNPVNSFCATFLGEALEYRVCARSAHVDTPFGAVEVNEELIGRELRVLMRPEAITFGSESADLGVNSMFVSGILTELKEVGPSRKVSLKLPGSGFEIHLISAWKGFPEVGSEVGMAIDPTMVFVFPAVEG
tara:strand:+ start:261 stop:1184 length:924 start_codon:yes stop_codon:yes gene_type:complete